MIVSIRAGIREDRMSDNQAVVKDFIAAFNENDLERIMAFFTEDCVYHNIPLEPAEGVEAIRGVLTGFSGISTEVDWVLHMIPLQSDRRGCIHMIPGKSCVE